MMTLFRKNVLPLLNPEVGGIHRRENLNSHESNLHCLVAVSEKIRE